MFGNTFISMNWLWVMVWLDNLCWGWILILLEHVHGMICCLGSLKGGGGGATDAVVGAAASLPCPPPPPPPIKSCSHWVGCFCRKLFLSGGMCFYVTHNSISACRGVMQHYCDVQNEKWKKKFRMLELWAQSVHPPPLLTSTPTPHPPTPRHPQPKVLHLACTECSAAVIAMVPFIHK